MLETEESNPVLTHGSDNGVAPRSDSVVLADLTDERCLWLAQHADGWQLGEQGVIAAALERLEPHLPAEQRWCVEFGAADNTTFPLTCGRILKIDGWKFLLIEPVHPQCVALRTTVPESAVIVRGSVLLEGDNTIDAHMERAKCHPDPALMVVDIDSIDYHIVAQMKSRPVVLCVETLDKLSPKDSAEPFIPTVAECGTHVLDDFGTQLQANSAAFDALLGPLGYRLIFRTRFNSIYVRGDFIPYLRKRALNLGCGDKNVPGYEPIDVRVNGKDIIKLDDIADGTIDETYCSHALEHLDCIGGQIALHEWARVLKPGGTMRVAVPDIQKIAGTLAKSESAEEVPMLFAMIYGSQNYKENYHRWGYSEATLRGFMYAAGIGNIRRFKPFHQDCSQNEYSLNLEGTKRWWPKIENPKVVLVMSQPEIAHTGHELAIAEMTKQLTLAGIDLYFEPPKGAFWDRDMTIGTGFAINRHSPDFLIYSDYDSQFEAEDVITLIRTINSDPRMAAIGAVQISRHNDAPLVMEQGIDYSGEITRVRYQHFGLMVVRREVFDELPQPWFWSVPGKDQNGEWDWTAWGRSDADITFWRNLDLMGFPVYQHNKVVIGHNIRAIKYPRDKGKGVQLIPIENYRRFGKPKDAVFNQALYKTKKPEGTT